MDHRKSAWLVINEILAMTVYHSLDLVAVPGGSTSACHRLPDTPAIYAFFSQTLFIPTSDPKLFVAALNQLIDRKASPTHEANVGSLHRVALDNRSTLGPKKQALLEEYAESENFRLYFADVIMKSSPLRSPLYVGQTENLKRRIIQHLDPTSDLATRLRKEGIALDECVLSYTLVEGATCASQPQVLTLIEDVITRLLRPGFVARIG
jgi:hypothetical protein